MLATSAVVVVSNRLVERLSSQRVRQAARAHWNESRQVPEELRGKRVAVEQIAEVEGVSVMRVRQILGTALEKLRAVSANDPDVTRLLKDIAARESGAA